MKNSGGGVYVSNNNPNDIETKNICNRYSFVIYHENAQNLGLDKNHELVYKYCQQKHVLMLADDDILLEGRLKKIEQYIENNDFLFAICNSVDIINSRLQDDYCYDIHQKIFEPLEAVDFFIYDKPMKIFPMLPYIGGIIVDMEKMRDLFTIEEKNIFTGTYHQYIGCLWKTLLSNFEDHELKVGFIIDPVVAIGNDSDKTWYPYIQSVMDKMNYYYDNLGLDSMRRRHISIIVKCSGRFSHYLYKPICRLLKLCNGKRNRRNIIK